MTEHINGDPALCCLPGAWGRAMNDETRRWGEPLDEYLIELANAAGVDPHVVDDNLVGRGWETHDAGYRNQVRLLIKEYDSAGC